MNTEIKEIAKIWPVVRDVFTVPHNDKEYKKLVSFLCWVKIPKQELMVEN